MLVPFMEFGKREKYFTTCQRENKPVAKKKTK
jgi:hypothetical protein